MINKTICNDCKKEKLDHEFPKKHGKRCGKKCLLCFRIRKNKNKTRVCKTCCIELSIEMFRIGENIIDRNYNCIFCFEKDLKKCYNCEEIKSYSDFDLPTGQKCLQCKKVGKKENAKKYYKENIEKISEASKKYYINNADKTIKRSAEYRKMHKKEINIRQQERKKMIQSFI